MGLKENFKKAVKQRDAREADQEKKIKSIIKEYKNFLSEIESVITPVCKEIASAQKWGLTKHREENVLTVDKGGNTYYLKYPISKYKMKAPWWVPEPIANILNIDTSRSAIITVGPKNRVGVEGFEACYAYIGYKSRLIMIHRNYSESALVEKLVESLKYDAGVKKGSKREVYSITSNGAEKLPKDKKNFRKLFHQSYSKTISRGTVAGYIKSYEGS